MCVTTRDVPSSGVWTTARDTILERFFNQCIRSHFALKTSLNLTLNKGARADRWLTTSFRCSCGWLHRVPASRWYQFTTLETKLFSSKNVYDATSKTIQERLTFNTPVHNNNATSK
jgi:hypothetical protein